MVERAKMTGWYDPRRLVSIGIRVAISTVFGEFADRREAMAAAREVEPGALDATYDYNSKQAPGEPFWFDFVADTGDGWNPTYAIARLLARLSLNVDGAGPLPVGRILIMGGDQVYPTASREDYQTKLIAPYEEAAIDSRWPADFEPHLYAIPGNHDWYDGLAAFIGVFCGRRVRTGWSSAKPGRVIGGRRTQQTRSYFALRLPGKWWVWGVDIQLEGYIDQPQIEFFEHVAKEWMEPGSRLILCTGTPDWATVDVERPKESSFKNFSYVESLASLANNTRPDLPKHELRLVLTGDCHHYSRFTEGNRHYITAGGGGAFLHPTHNLVDKVLDWDYPKPGEAGKPKKNAYQREFRLQPNTFPNKDVSRRMAWRNLLFGWLNPYFGLTLGIVIGIFAWLLEANAHVHGVSLAQALVPDNSATFWSALCAYMKLVFASPWPSMLVMGAVAGYCAFASAKRKWLRWLVGGSHALAQTGVAVLLTILLAFCPILAGTPWLFIISVGALGSILASIVMGLYLLICLNCFREHANEAFSSLRIQDYKCFLRLCIDPDGKLTIFPVGLAKVPHGGGKKDGTDLKPQLIEDPIEIS